MFDVSGYREARLAGGFKFRDVAEIAGVDPSTIAAYETSKGKPSESMEIRWRQGLRQLLEQRGERIKQALSEMDAETVSWSLDDSIAKDAYNRKVA